MATMPRFNLTKPEPTVIRLINRRHTNPIMIEQGDETTLAREGKRFGYMLAQYKLRLPIGWGCSRDVVEFLGAIAQGEEDATRAALLAPAALPAPKKRTKKIHELRVLEPPVSETDQRLLCANDLAYTKEFGYSAASIRNEFRDVHEPGVTHLPPGPKNDGVRLAGWYVFQRYQRQHGL
jgi:hypothetical protein